MHPSPSTFVADVCLPGRTTFVNTLCGRKVLSHKESDDPSIAHVEEGVKIKPITVGKFCSASLHPRFVHRSAHLKSELELDEDGTRISLTIVDTPGFGDQIDNEARYVKLQQSQFHRHTLIMIASRKLSATLRGSTMTSCELDIELMKRLSPRVNVIPVIGKADALTPAELAESKKLVMEDIEHYRIPVYNFPYDIEEDDEDTVEENAELRGLMPFAIVGSEDVVEVNGKKVRARQYPWGIVEVDNPRHSDFLAVRSALLHSHLADLKEITHDFLYENYRTEKLSKSVEGGAAP